MTRHDDSHYERFSRPILQGLLIVTLLVAGPARAFTFVESVDMPGGNIGTSNFFVGTAAVGGNSVSGSLSGSCLNTSFGLDCNSAPGGASGNSQDSFVIQIAPGTQLDSIIVTTSNVSGPQNFSASFSVDSFPGPNQVFVPSLPLGSSTANILGSPLGANLYSLSVFGQAASQTGAFGLDWNIELGVSQVPVPAAAWLFGSALGLLGLRRKSAAV